MDYIAHTPLDAHRRDVRQARTGAQAHTPAAMEDAGRDGGTADAQDDASLSLQRGYVSLDAALLRRLRQARMFSQQDLADDCWRRNIRLSLTTIKRAEAGRVVRFRIAREFARCFDLPVARIAHLCGQGTPADV